MRYYRLEPEVAGELGSNTVLDTSTHPPRVNALHYSITDWLGDELLTSFPVFLISENLASLLTAKGLRSFTLKDVEVTLSPEAEELLAGQQIPKFRWFDVTGRAGVDDIGLTDTAALVVSERGLEALRCGQLENCEVEELNSE